MSEHPSITAARAALADTERRATADMEARARAVRRLTAFTDEWFAGGNAMLRARRAWKSAVNRKANALERALRMHG